MSSNTPNLELLKKDPITDGNDTFNVKTMMNDNWDKIDRAVGEIRKEVQDISIPDASLTKKGISQLTNAVDSASEVLVPTAKAVKTVNDALVSHKADIALNVKSFGAVGDGVSDDSSYIVDAIVKAKGRSVYFPKGVYNVSKMISVSGKVTLIGDGDATIIGFKYDEQNSVTINYQNPGSATPFMTLFVADGLNFQSDVDGNVGLSIKNKPNKSIHRSFTITNCNFYGKQGLLTANCGHSVLSNCNFFQNQFGWATYSCTNIVVNNCQWLTVYGIGIYIRTSSDDVTLPNPRMGGENIKLVGCTFIDGVVAIDAQAHNYLVLDSCLIDYFNCGVILHGGRYARMTNTYIGYEGSNRSFAPWYIAPSERGCITLKGFSTKTRSSGFSAVNCEFMTYTSSAPTWSAVRILGGGLSFTGCEEISISNCRFGVDSPSFAGKYIVEIDTAMDVRIKDNNFYAGNMPSTFITPWVYINSNSNRITFEGNNVFNVTKN